MRQGQNNKRARGRGRKQQSATNRTYDSNGPDVKIRGTASQIAEKYVGLARDAQVGGDPVASENYLQHAEHYLRIIAHAQAQNQNQQQNQNQNQSQNIAPVPGSGAQPAAVNGESAPEGAQESRNGAAEATSDQPAEQPVQNGDASAANGEADGEADGRSRRPRGRRGRPKAVADDSAPADAEAASGSDASDVAGEGSSSQKSGGDDPVVAEAG